MAPGVIIGMHRGPFLSSKACICLTDRVLCAGGLSSSGLTSGSGLVSSIFSLSASIRLPFDFEVSPSNFFGKKLFSMWPRLIFPTFCESEFWEFESCRGMAALLRGAAAERGVSGASGNSGPFSKR